MEHLNSDGSEHIRINGSKNYVKDVQAKTIRIVGHGRFKGMVQANSFKNNGSCRVESDCMTKDFSNVGHGHFYSITAEQFYSSGSILVDTSVHVDTFHASGLIQIADKLTAEEVLIKLHYKSFIKHILANKDIEIRSNRLSLVNLLRLGRKNGGCSTIQGRHITIEYLDADLVIGEEVVIGAGCKIREVQYSKSLNISSRSVVKHTVKIE